MNSNMEDDTSVSLPLPPKTYLNKDINPPPVPKKSNRSFKKVSKDKRRISNNEMNCFKKSHYFNDGKRAIDYILVWDSSNFISDTEINKRKIFENNLTKEGLELEFEEPDYPYKLGFTKIHANKVVCRRYSELLRLRMPMKKIEKFQNIHSSSSKVVELVSSPWNSFMSKFFYVNKKVFPDTSHAFTAIYSRDKEYLFDTESSDFFTPQIRSRIIQFILDRTVFVPEGNDDICNFGIEHLINQGFYCAAYPLHDGPLHVPGSARYTLYHEWASIKQFVHYQPVDYIKEYFGVKIALYFTWLGFYTYMLIPASIIGLICFIYSLCTVANDQPSKDICNKSFEIYMCPLCDMKCSYWNIEDTCVHARITYLFDNITTIFFTVFMCFWATMFLEFWKRYSAEITHRWDLTDFDKQEEYPRPQYLARLRYVSTRTINAITNDIEPKVPFWTVRLPITIFSFSVVIFLVLVAFSAVIAVILYRISILAAFYAYGNNEVMTSYAIILTNATAATINLSCIVILNIVYSWLAKYLTELELLRTQTEFDDSLTLKMYLFQFVNYYASIFYIAFFKGKLTGYPKKYRRIFGIRQEECGPGGCLMELCIQLSIIMIGKQTFNTFMEIVEPLIQKWWRTLCIKHKTKCQLPQWIEDYKLIQWGPQALFPEYLEMVMQYGFVTIFVSAFPLAPIFALLNNILEMRLDAKKLLTFYRRPIAQRVKSIGIWYRILDSIGKLAVFTNGVIIAFTSEFIPKLVYMLTVSNDYTLVGYVNYSLSYMNITELDVLQVPTNRYNITYCRYSDFRHPPWAGDQKYNLTSMFWKVLIARLLFIVVFQNVVALIIILIRWCIPDVPPKLKEQIQRERYITNEIIISHEASRVQSLFRNPQK